MKVRRISILLIIQLFIALVSPCLSNQSSSSMAANDRQDMRIASGKVGGFFRSVKKKTVHTARRAKNGIKRGARRAKRKTIRTSRRAKHGIKRGYRRGKAKVKRGARNVKRSFSKKKTDKIDEDH